VRLADDSAVLAIQVVERTPSGADAEAEGAGTPFLVDALAK
jgi:hypothetical protein